MLGSRPQPISVEQQFIFFLTEVREKQLEDENKITSNNLDFIFDKNLITIYNNVKYNGIQGLLLADKVDMNILKKETEIFMFNKEKKVEIQYNN